MFQTRPFRHAKPSRKHGGRPTCRTNPTDRVPKGPWRLVAYRFPNASNATSWGELNRVAKLVAKPPPGPTRRTESVAVLAAYRLPLESKAIPSGEENPVAKTVATPPLGPTLLIVPLETLETYEVAVGAELHTDRIDKSSGECSPVPPPKGILVIVLSVEFATYRFPCAVGWRSPCDLLVRWRKWTASRTRQVESW